MVEPTSVQKVFAIIQEKIMSTDSGVGTVIVIIAIIAIIAWYKKHNKEGKK